MPKRQGITIETKLKILKYAETNGAVTHQEVASHFGIDRTAVVKILKRKTDFLKANSTSNSPLKRTRLNEGYYREIDKAVFAWYRVTRQAHGDTPIPGPIVKEKARQIALDMGIQDFRASNGWLHGFKKRFKISGQQKNKEQKQAAADTNGTALPAERPSEGTAAGRNHPTKDSMSSADSEVSRERSPTPPTEANTLSPRPPDIKQDSTRRKTSMVVKTQRNVISKRDPSAENSEAASPAPVSLTTCRSSTPSGSGVMPTSGGVHAVDADGSIIMAERNGEAPGEEQMPLHLSAISPIKLEDKGHPERKRRASNDSLDSSTKASESGLGDDNGKDDDDDGDEDDEEKMPPGHEYDPERLKAFNMFVRLFVDENLDRMVPISKQPKDKIQAILEACDRQFPEFHERSRKRIRTYLKSCRRMRRSKEANGWEQLRPTPPHLTSAAAEGILAQACENESNNAKRMRMGLEPLPAMVTSAPTSVTVTPQSQAAPTPPQASPQGGGVPQSSTPTPAPVAPQQPPHLERQTPLGAGGDYMRHATPPAGAAAFRPPPHELPSPFFTNSNGIFRPGFPSTYQHPAHHHPPVIQHTTMTNSIQNGPTDLSMKKSPNASKNQLNPSEVATIKQLIAGYRESAAFLYRSADELEQLLLQQN